MEYTLKKTGQGCELVLDGKLTLEHAEKLKNALMEALEGGDPVVINAEKVIEVDLSSLQLFCAAHKSAVNTQKNIAFSNHISEVFKKTVRDSGLPSVKAAPQT